MQQVFSLLQLFYLSMENGLRVKIYKHNWEKVMHESIMP